MCIDREQRQGFIERRQMEQQHNIVRHLRSLPQEIGQPYDWTEFRRRASRQRTKANAAIAAALFLAIVCVAAWIRVTRPGAPVFTASESESPGLPGPAASGTPDSVDSRVDAEERWLVSLPSEPIVVRVGTRAAVAGLEDRIAQLDDFLSAARVEGTQPAKLVAMEEQRARLVNSLVQVRYAETLVSKSR
jgi:hypothetical protein